MGNVSARLDARLSHALLAAGFAVLAVVLWHAPLNHDSAYLMLAAERYLDGRSLYLDQSMANPPLATWLHAGVVMLDRTFGSIWGGPFGLQALIAVVLVAVALVLTVSARILACIGELAPRTRTALLLAGFAAVAVAPLRDFGQRDHLFALLTFPYVVLMGARFSGAVPPRGLGALTGAVAFFGVALKPHFALLPLVLEGAWLWRTRRPLGVFRPETLTLAGLMIAYAASVVVLYPEYFTDVLPRYAQVFFAFTQPLAVLIVQPEVVVALVALLAFARDGKGGAPHPADGVILAGALATAAALAIYFLQKKGWSYQRAPALVYATWTLAALALIRIRLWSVAGVCLAAALVILRGPYFNVYQDTVVTAIAAAAGPGGAAYVFTTNVSVPYPSLQYAGMEPASRFNTLWMVPGLARARAEDPGALHAIDAFARDAILEDFTRAAPQAVAVDGRDPKPYFNGVPFDYLDWAREDPRFARVWSSYAFLRRAYGFDIYVRKPGGG